MSNVLPEQGLSFDDVLLLPDYSAILPDEVTTRTRLTKELELNIPIVSAAMDTVTESATAISMARAGGLGFIHRNLSIAEQVVEVDRVKKSESGMIVDPVTVHPDATISDVLNIMAKYLFFIGNFCPNTLFATHSVQGIKRCRASRQALG